MNAHIESHAVVGSLNRLRTIPSKTANPARNTPMFSI